MKINEAVKTDIQNSVLCWLATVDADGSPNVTPKEIFASYGDDRIVIADIASSHSVQNVQAQPQVCVSFVDIFRQRGFKLTGRAAIIHPENPIFLDLGADLLRMAGSDSLSETSSLSRLSESPAFWHQATGYSQIGAKRTGCEAPTLPMAFDRFNLEDTVLSHTTVGVANVPAARRFYDPLLKHLGLTLKFADEKWAGWKHPKAERPLFIIARPFDGMPSSAGNGQMIALLAPDRSLVDECYSVALQHGGSDEGKPDLRPEYHADYYGAYFRDPDGNKLCVCCHEAE